MTFQDKMRDFKEVPSLQWALEDGTPNLREQEKLAEGASNGQGP